MTFRPIPSLPSSLPRPRRFRVALLGVSVPGLLLLPGCSLATLPFRATSKAVDWSTTSRDEADRHHGRALRKRAERERRCERGYREDC